MGMTLGINRGLSLTAGGGGGLTPLQIYNQWITDGVWRDDVPTTG